MRQLARQIKINRIYLKSSFKDFDPLNKGHISDTQFFRVLHMCLHKEITKFSSPLLIRKYLDKDNLKELNYFHFLKDLEGYIEEMVQEKENV